MKIALTTSLRKGRRGIDLSPSSLLIRYNTPHPNKQHLPFKQTGITTFFHSDASWPRSGPFCWQNLCSSCNSGIGLVDILSTLFQHRTNLLGSNQPLLKYTAFLLDVLYWKWPRSIVYSCFSTKIVHLRNLLWLSTPFAQMLLTDRWVSYLIVIHKHSKPKSWS